MRALTFPLAARETRQNLPSVLIMLSYSWFRVTLGTNYEGEMRGNALLHLSQSTYIPVRRDTGSCGFPFFSPRFVGVRVPRVPVPGASWGSELSSFRAFLYCCHNSEPVNSNKNDSIQRHDYRLFRPGAKSSSVVVRRHVRTTSARSNSDRDEFSILL